MVRPLLALVVASALLPAAASAQSLVPELDFYVTDNRVEDIEVVGDSLYVGGHFHYVGRYTGCAAPVSISTGETIAGFPKANGWVYAIIPDGAGGWFLGGDFTEIGGLARNRVAHILPDLSVDPDWEADVDHQVRTLAVHASGLYLRGLFSNIDGVPRDKLAALSFDNGDLLAWDPNPESGLPTDMYLDDDLLYVTGQFTEIAGEARRMAAFDLTSGALTAFDPEVTNEVTAVAARDGVVYIGGRFTTVGDSTRNRLAALDGATGDVLDWSPDLGGSSVIFDMALRDSTIVVGGAFSSVNGVSHRSIAELYLDTGGRRGVIGETPGFVNAIQVQGDSLYFAGTFTNVNDDDEHRFLSGFDLETGEILDLPHPIADVLAIAVQGDTLWVGGEFSAVSNVERPHIAAFHASTLELLDWNPDVQDIVFTLQADVDESTLYVGGRFLSIDGNTRNKVAAFDHATGALVDFLPDFDGDIYDMAVTDTLLYLAGTYHAAGGLPRQDLASVDRRTGLITPWAPRASGFVNQITVHRDTVYVGGGFGAINDSTRTSIAAIDGQTGELLDWGSDIVFPTNAYKVYAFQPIDHPSYPEGGMFVGGEFLDMGIGLRRSVALVKRDTGNTLWPWNARLDGFHDHRIHDFELHGDLLYMSGNIDGVFGNGARGVAAVDIFSAEASGWVIDAGGAKEIAIADSMVFVAGGMNLVQGHPTVNLAAFRRDSSPPLPASNLVASPGDGDREIDLTWEASPSPDAKDYLVYRTATAGGDTTGNLVAVTEATALIDMPPSYEEWFYRVYSRDTANNLGPASNEDSAVPPQITEPVVRVAVHQNPLLTRHCDVIVVSDSVLVMEPVVTIDPPSGGPTPVAMVPIPGSVSAYRGPWEIAEDGLHAIHVIATTDQDSFEFEREFTATLLAAGTGGRVRSARGLAVVDVPAGALRDATCILVEELGDERARIGPPLELDREVGLEITYDPTRYPEPHGLFIARVEDGRSVPLPSEVDPERNVVRARVQRLGEFELGHDPSIPRDDPAPLRLVIHPNLPNPFHGSTTLRFELPRSGHLEVTVHDVTGRRVARLHRGAAPAGRMELPWNGRNDRGVRVGAGVYFARVSTDHGDQSLKMVVLR